MPINSVTFKKQIVEDIQSIRDAELLYDQRLENDEFAFNYWVLCHLFHIDVSAAKDYVTDINDGGIDSYVFFPEDKQLFIIQNKYYKLDGAIDRESVSDFLTNPLARLSRNDYTHCTELQNIFNEVKNNPTYTVFFQFITTSERRLTPQTKELFDDFNNKNHSEFDCTLLSEFIGLHDLATLYYGKSYQETNPFDFDLHTYLGQGYAAVKNDYKLNLPYETYYIITPVLEIYKLIKEAEKKEYPLFDENIREWLGDSKGSINSGIIRTLKDVNQRSLFLYYNNGITINCNSGIKKSIEDGKTILNLPQPKVVNGCQTVNSIKVALSSYSDQERNALFESVFVLVKVLIIVSSSTSDKDFYKNVVRYTNMQNVVNEKMFTISDHDLFEKLQSELKSKGFWLCIKQSDRNKFKESDKRFKRDLLTEAIIQTPYLPPGLLNKESQLRIDLEKVLQIFIAFMLSPQTAVQEKSKLLNHNSSIFSDYSLEIMNYLTTNNIVMLIALYLRADKDLKTLDSTLISPFYIIGFLGNLLKINSPNNKLTPFIIQEALSKIFDSEESFTKVYTFLREFCESYTVLYKQNLQAEYNTMIKSAIRSDFFNSAYTISMIRPQNKDIVDKYFKHLE